MREETSSAVVDRFRESEGRRADRVLQILGKIHPYYEAWKTEAGKNILHYSTSKYSTLLDKQVSEPDKISQSELIEMKVLKELILHIMNIFEQYKKGLEEVKKYDGKRQEKTTGL